MQRDDSPASSLTPTPSSSPRSHVLVSPLSSSPLSSSCDELSSSGDKVRVLSHLAHPFAVSLSGDDITDVEDNDGDVTTDVDDDTSIELDNDDDDEEADLAALLEAEDTCREVPPETPVQVGGGRAAKGPPPPSEVPAAVSAASAPPSHGKRSSHELELDLVERLGRRSASSPAVGPVYAASGDVVGDNPVHQEIAVLLDFSLDGADDDASSELTAASVPDQDDDRYAPSPVIDRVCSEANLLYRAVDPLGETQRSLFASPEPVRTPVPITPYDSPWRDDSSTGRPVRSLARRGLEAQRQQQQQQQLRHDWNDRFLRAQALPEAMPDQVWHKYRRFTRLSVDFIDIVKTYGRTIIAEYFLADSEKTIKPSRDYGGIAGGSKYVVHGVMMKLAHDPQVMPNRFLYGGVASNYEFAAKAAGHELTGSINYYQSHRDGLHVPMQATLDYMGFRLVAMPMLPLDRMIYGSSDGGASFVASDERFNSIMRSVATSLHLAPCVHYAHVDDAEPVILYSAGDVEGHIGTDQRLYLLDLARALPPESPSAAPHLPSSGGQTVFFRLLRPELLQILRKRGFPPLSPDALTQWGNSGPAGKSSELHVNAHNASLYLVREQVPAFATELLGLSEEQLAELAVSEEAHRHGINLRHIGLVRYHVRQQAAELEDSPTAKLVLEHLLVEIVQRAIKNLLRRVLRSVHSAQPSAYSCLQRIARFLNLVTRANAEERQDPAARFWDSIVAAAVQQRYGEVALDVDEVAPNGSLFALVQHRLVEIVAYVLKRTGVVVDPASEREFRRDPIGFRFVVFDLDMDVRVKHMSIISYSRAKMLSLSAFTDEAARHRLLRMAVSSFSATMRVDPLNTEWKREARRASLRLQAWQSDRAGDYVAADMLMLETLTRALGNGCQDETVQLTHELIAMWRLRLGSHNLTTQHMMFGGASSEAAVSQLIDVTVRTLETAPAVARRTLLAVAAFLSTAACEPLLEKMPTLLATVVFHAVSKQSGVDLVTNTLDGLRVWYQLSGQLLQPLSLDSQLEVYSPEAIVPPALFRRDSDMSVGDDEPLLAKDNRQPEALPTVTFSVRDYIDVVVQQANTLPLAEAIDVKTALADLLSTMSSVDAWEIVWNLCQSLVDVREPDAGLHTLGGNPMRWTWKSAEGVVTESQAQFIEQAIRTSSMLPLRCIDLHLSQIKDEYVEWIAEAIAAVDGQSRLDMVVASEVDCQDWPSARRLQAGMQRVVRLESCAAADLKWTRALLSRKGVVKQSSGVLRELVVSDVGAPVQPLLRLVELCCSSYGELGVIRLQRCGLEASDMSLLFDAIGEASVEVLDLSGNKLDGEVGFESKLHLRELGLRDATVSASCLQMLLRGSQDSLEVLDLAFVKGVAAGVLMESCGLVPGLRELDVSGCEVAIGWERLSKCCPALEVLRAAGNPAEMVVGHALQWSSLRELRCGVVVEDEAAFVAAGDALHADTLVPVLLHLAEHLESVALCHVKCVDDDVLDELAQRMGKVKEVTIADCFSVSGEALTRFFSQVHGLTRVDVRGSMATAETMAVILEMNPGLEALCVSECHYVYGEMLPREFGACLRELGLGHLPIGPRELERILKACGAQLTHLDLSACHDIDDGALKAIADACPMLVSLTLQRTEDISDDGVRHVIRRCPRLAALDVSECEGVSDASLVVLALQGSRIRHLRVNKCPEVTDVGLEQVLRRRRLETLEVSAESKEEYAPHVRSSLQSLRGGSLRTLVVGGRALSDSDLAGVLERCPQLRDLDASWCAVGDGLVSRLGELCPELRRCDLSWCRQVSQDAIGVLKQGARHLRALNTAGCHSVSPMAKKRQQRTFARDEGQPRHRKPAHVAKTEAAQKRAQQVAERRRARLAAQREAWKRRGLAVALCAVCLCWVLWGYGV